MCIATFRFGAVPRLALVHLTSHRSSGASRWLRLGAPVGIAAAILARRDAANINGPLPARSDTRRPHARNAVKRPLMKRETETSYDAHRRIFADRPHSPLFEPSLG
jgi:hypothetical protein